MSTNRLQEELFDLHEINRGIVARQVAALAELDRILANLRDAGDDATADDVANVRTILTGR